jgi:hypothetical protein
VDDGTARPGNTNIFNGWGEAADSTLFMNATLWATRRAAGAGDLTPPAVTVLSPNGGEAWKTNSAHAITWTATDNVGVTTVDLAYSVDGGLTFPFTIATGLANSGTYNWNVPNIPGTQNRVRVTARDASLNSGIDDSDANFTIDRWIITASAGAGGGISPSGTVYVANGLNRAFTITPNAGYQIADVVVDGGSVGAVASYTFVAVTANHTIAAGFVDITAPAVTLLSPNGGESFEGGSTQPVTWSASDNAAVTSVTLEYSAAGSDGPWTVVASGLANSGSYDWTVPVDASAQVSVRVTALDAATNSSSDTSDAVFTILDPTAGVEDGPLAFALARPAPNPFSGTATLSFSLPRPGHARLDVIDAAGRRVAGRHGDFAAGRHAWRWDGRLADGSRARAGLYFVRLATPFGTRLQRLVRLD